MRALPLTVAAVIAIGSAGPALGDAVTYKGTLGTLPIILEITTPPEDGDRPFGRYAYLSRGTDIPLDGVAARAGTFRMEEEAPCSEKTCVPNEDGVVAPPIAAVWALTANGTALSGTWTDRATGKKLPIKLERRGARAIDTTSSTPLEALQPDAAVAAAGDPPVLKPKDLPYDFLKLDWPRKAGPETRVGEVVLRTETDGRNGVAYPTVVSLGGDDTGPVNAFLLQQRLQAELSMFSCRSQAYAGLSWSTWHADPAGDDSDNIPNVTVEHASPRLIGLAESGSFFCGGAHPENYLRHILVDAAEGTPIVPETLLAGWNAVGRDGEAVDPQAYDNSDASLTFAPSADLLAYIRSKREKFDADTEAECGIDDLLASNLGVYFTQDDLVFTLRDLPHAIFACGDDLLKVPLAEARPLLTPEAARYFSALDQ